MAYSPGILSGVSTEDKQNVGNSSLADIDGKLPVATDAFGRFRVSSPETIFDSKLLFDSGSLFWDDQETSGSGTASTHSTNSASVTLAVSGLTSGTRVRQSKRRFNYQSGKSMLVMMTGILGVGGNGIISRIGFFDGNNGLFFENNAGVAKVVRRTKVSGSSVDITVA